LLQAAHLAHLHGVFCIFVCSLDPSACQNVCWFPVQADVSLVSISTFWSEVGRNHDQKSHDLFLQPPDNLTCFVDHCFGHDNDQKGGHFSESKHLAFCHRAKEDSSGEASGNS